MKANNRRKVFGDAVDLLMEDIKEKNGSWWLADAFDKENPALP
nr:hypothetical protein [uncultured Blautia sp.]